MIGIKLVLGDMGIIATVDATYSPDILDDLARTARRALVELNESLDDEPSERLTWNEAMRRDMQLDE
jgi:hypothetical protein